MSTQDLNGRKSTLLQRYQRNAESQDPLNQPMNTAPMMKSTSQRSLQNSTLLQRRYSKTTSQDLQVETAPPAQQPTMTSSQRSLNQSKLLQRYNKQNSLDSQEPPKPAPQHYSSQKSLENSKLLQRYGPQVNNSQEFTGLAARESTPVARFQRSGSLDQERIVRPSLLSRYTPRFGQSLDRNKAVGAGAYSNYSSQQSLDQNLSQSQNLGDYGSDHFGQYDSRNLRSRSSSLARGLNSRSMQRDLGPAAPMNIEMEKENMPMEPITQETLPVIATTEPVMGIVASALPMPMLGLIPPTPVVETTKPTLTDTDANKLQPVALPLPPQPIQPIVTPEPEKPKRKEPVKPPRKDLAASATVSIPIPNITAPIVTIDPPKPIIPTTKLAAPVVPKDPSPPLFSNRDRMEHYGSASDPSPSSPISLPPPQPPLKQQQLSSTPAPVGQHMNTNLLMPISDLSSRRSMTDLRQTKQEEGNAFAMDIDEASDRNDLRVYAKKKDPVKNTLASAFEQIAVLSVPQVSNVLEEPEKIEALPPDRKLKKRDHTYHPSFVPKQAKLEEEERKKQEAQAKQEAHKMEVERKKEEERLKKEDDRLRKENEKMKKEEEKQRKDEEKRFKAEEDKRRKHEEKIAREEEKRKKEEEKRKLKEDKKKAAAQKSLPAEQEVVVPAEEESIDLGSHLDQYSVSAGPAKPRSTSATGRLRSSGTPRGSQGALNRQTLPGMSNPMYSSQQSLDRGTGVQSKMLQRYAKRSGSQDFTHHAEMQQFVKDVHRSQGSLEQRVPRSSLLQRYTPKPLSASTAAGQAPAPPSTPRSTSQVSLDKNRIEKSSLLQRYKPKGGSVEQSETDQRMGAVVFQPKKIPGKYSDFDYRDHEYEPIGEPVDSKATGASSLAPPTDAQGQRKLSSASLRVPGDDADTISMNELQKDIEDRYFNRPADEEPLEVPAETSVDATQEKTSKMKAVMNRAQESGKKAMARAQESSKSAMAKAQEGGKSLHQKLRKQTDKFKTKMSTINIKKDRDAAPLASPEIVTTPEIEKLDFTIAEPKSEQETEEVQPVVTVTVEDTQETEQDEAATEAGASKKKFKAPEFSKLKNIHMPKLQKPEFKRPEFTKITKPKMPKLKTPDMSKFKRPEMPKFLTEKPDFSKLKMPEKIGTIKLQRSKSLKEPADGASAASPSDAGTPSVIDGEDSKKKINYTDFSTYPRLLDKFKRQKSAPGNASVRASTPPPLEFTKAGKTTRSKGPSFISRWTEKASEDEGSSRFFTGSEQGERESSVEKRIRQHLERADFDTPELPVTAEQKQLEEYDKENREIHLMSAARHDEFMKRKPPMERQESDLASEEEKQFWASSLGQKIRQNIDMNSNDFDFLDEDERLRVARENEDMGLSERDRARFLGEHSEKEYDMRSTTPYSNKECQSSGSSGIRRRKGVLEEIDDDEFFLRQKGISKDNIQMGEYISSAIKEGLSTPVNALAEMGRYDSYDQDMDASERMSMEYRGEPGAAGNRYYQPSFESDDMSNKQSFTDEFRRNADFFKTFPPDRPVRKQKKSYNEEQFDEDAQKVPYDSYPQGEDEVEFYRKYASEEPQHLGAKDERYIDEESIGNGFSQTGAAVPPTPPRRRKKRFRDVTPSQLEPFANGLTSKPIYNSFTIGPETHIFNAEVPLAREESFTTPLPTPRRSRSRSQLSKAFDDDRTSRGAESYIFGAVDSAMMKHSMDLSESNGYATVRKDPPPRPPAPMRRRRSTRSLGDQRQFSTLPNFHSVSPVRPSRNYSTIHPDRPPRRSNTNLVEGAMRSASVSKDDFTEYEEIEQMENQARMQQSLATGAVVSKMKDRPLPPPPRPPRDHKKPKKPDHDDGHDLDGGAEKIVALHPFERVEEVEIAIQTDPLREDYELDIEVSETLGAIEDEAPTKTLQEILKEEQQAEIDRARQLAEANNLMRDIQKFRESTSSLSQQGSRPETPAASILERRVSVPTASSMRSEVRPLSNENLSEQDLAHAEDDKYIAALVKKYVSEEKVTPSETAKRQPRATATPQPAPDVDSERLRDIESMIVNEQVQREEFRSIQSEPAAPPRRRSLVASSQDLARGVEISPIVIEGIVELQQQQQQQLEDLKRQHEEQQRLHDQKLEEQRAKLELQQLQQEEKERELARELEEQRIKLEQQQLHQQEKERELARELEEQRAKLEQQKLQQQEKERELARELEEQRIKLEKQQRERDNARELEQQLARELEQQRIREIQRIHELEMQRAREAEMLRAKEAELLKAKEEELIRAKESEMLRAREAELLRAREAELLRAEAELLRVREAELLKARETELFKAKITEAKREADVATPVDDAVAQPSTEATPITITETQEPSNVTSEEHVTKEAAPARPPPPRISPQPPVTGQFPYQEYLPYSLPPQSFYPVRNFSDDEGALPQAPHRRRRHHRSRRESTSEEEFQRDQRKQRHGTRSPEPSIPALGGQLIRACGNSIRETGDELMTILRASSKDENKRDLHIALIILIVIVAGLMALGMSAERDVHHHHWDYFNPPGHS